MCMAELAAVANGLARVNCVVKVQEVLLSSCPHNNAKVINLTNRLLNILKQSSL